MKNIELKHRRDFKSVGTFGKLSPNPYTTHKVEIQLINSVLREGLLSAKVSNRKNVQPKKLEK